ncbi:hypothetical protein [uncultured Ruegeria sp.]|uniref:hypothetical protein n=1 Tax=uncultured Ruegeria sp. TaxID=259304 RepID=UPI00261D14F6|nr:hypothetical protein [uncultured Ruegeria sp.]
MVSRENYLLMEVEHFAPYSKFDQSASRDERLSQQVDAVIKDYRRMGYDTPAISSRSQEIEDIASARVSEHDKQLQLVEAIKQQFAYPDKEEPFSYPDNELGPDTRLMKTWVSEHINEIRQTETHHPYFSSLADLVDHTEFQRSEDYALPADRFAHYMTDTIGEEAFNELERNTQGIITTINKMSSIAEEVEDFDLRARMSIEVGELRGQIAEVRPYDAELQLYTVRDYNYTNDFAPYHFDREAGRIGEDWKGIKAEIVERAEATGIDADKFLERLQAFHLSQNSAVSLGTTAEWKAEDYTEAQIHFASEGNRNAEELGVRAVDELHEFASARITQMSKNLVQERGGHFAYLRHESAEHSL